MDQSSNDASYRRAWCRFCANDPEQCHADMDCEEPAIAAHNLCRLHTDQQRAVTGGPERAAVSLANDLRYL